jgi:hypothetical protein
MARREPDPIHEGKFYWFVQRGEGDGLWLRADRVEMGADGSLVFECEVPVYGLAAGSWDFFYAASEADGHPLAVVEARGINGG